MDEICGLCGHEMTLDRCGYAAAYSGVKLVYLCHADDHSCYHEWTVYGIRPENPTPQTIRDDFDLPLEVQLRPMETIETDLL